METNFLDHKSSIKQEISRWTDLAALGPLGEIGKIDYLSKSDKQKIDNLMYTTNALRAAYVLALQKLLAKAEHD